MMRTLKEELLWLREWRGVEELKAALSDWFAGYNRGYLHSALGYRTPERFETEYKNSHFTQLATA